jgi:putative transposase
MRENPKNNTMRVAYKYKANPTKKQKEELESHFQIHANLYNKALETLNNSEEWIPKYKMHKKLTQWKEQQNNNFEKINSKAAQQTINRIYRAVKSLSAKKQKGEKVGKLRYKSKLNSIEYNQSGFKTNKNTVKLHQIGKIPINKHRKTTGEIKGVTIKKSNTGEWWTSIICQVETPSKIPIKDIKQENVIGIDLNISNLLADTEGRKLESLYKFLKPELEKIRKEHQKLSRKQKRSNNWHKQKKKLAKAYQDLKNKRDDALHKLSKYYVENYDLICIEDIESKKLSENGNKGLGKYIREQAWRRLVEFIKYKASQAGTHIQRVNPEYTSQDCSRCNNREEKQLGEQSHECKECGLEMDRDVNASWNILYKGLDMLREEGLGQGLPEVTLVETDTSSIPLSTVTEARSLSLSGRA